MLYDLSHRTSYSYASPVDLAWHALHLRARTLPFQTVHRSEIVSAPVASETREATDHFGNTVTYLVLKETHDAFIVEVRSRIEVAFPPIGDPARTPAWEAVRAALWGDGFPAPVDASEFVHRSPLIAGHPELLDYALPSFSPGRPMAEALIDLTRRIKLDFAYDPGATDLSTPLLQVLKQRRGVCQDFAHVQIGCLRSLGLAARYVSGYIRTRPRAGQEALRGADASHAWVSAWCGPEAGCVA